MLPLMLYIVLPPRKLCPPCALTQRRKKEMLIYSVKSTLSENTHIDKVKLKEMERSLILGVFPLSFPI